MSYRLAPDEPLPAGIRRVAREQLGQALDSLNDANLERDEAIHDVRKRCKKVRAVLRLVRDEIGEDVFDRENSALRDAARELSDLRDSTVRLQTLADLHERYPEQVPARAVNLVKVGLMRLYAHSDHLYRVNHGRDRVCAALQDAHARIAEWPVQDETFAALSDGLQRVYKCGYKGLARAQAAPELENFHEWRKRVKYLWYHMRLLENLWPALLDELGDELHRLADLLCDAHDLALLRQTLLDPSTPNEDSAAVQATITLIDRQRTHLHASAFPQGMLIYQEKPKQFVKRMTGYWDTWQAASAAEAVIVSTLPAT
jgi:CHAD domain-containing protein